MRMYLASIVTFAAIIALGGCSPSIGDLVVLEVGDQRISLQEFERFYERNAGTWEAAKQSSVEERENFLDLLTNYKLKLRHAYARNLLNEPDVRNELRDYQRSVAATFIIDREVTEPGLRLMYERRKEEIRASHILIRLNPTSTPEETLKAWNRAMDIIGQIKEGKDFGELAAEASDDQSAKTNKGDIAWFTTGQLVAPFEDVAYTFRVNENTRHPVRTQFGYHVIKVTDRKPAVYAIRVSHIMIALRSQGTDSTADSALLKIRALQDSLKAGADFAALASRYSEDPSTAPKGGALGQFYRRRFVQDFEEAAFTLNPGEISDAVKTMFGYHLIKCEEVKPLPSYEEMRSELQRLYQAYRYNDDYREYVGRWKQRIAYSQDNELFREFFSYVDSTRLPSDSLWSAGVPGEFRRKTAIRVARQVLTIDSIIAVLSTRQEYKETPVASANLFSQIEKIGDMYILEAASADLDDRQPEFKALMQEFQDGVVLYRAEQDEVWNKIEVNEEKLRAFYAERQNQYPLPNRVEFVEVSADSQRLLMRFMRDVQRGRKLDTLVARSKGKLHKSSRGLVAADTDTLSRLAWAGQVGKPLGPIQVGTRYVVIQPLKKDPARNKTFEEASAEVSTVFQDFEAKRREAEWLGRIRKEFPVVQHKEHLKHAFEGDKPS